MRLSFASIILNGDSLSCEHRLCEYLLPISSCIWFSLSLVQRVKFLWIRPILFYYYTTLLVCNFLVNGICFWDLSSHSPPLPLSPLHFLTSSPGRSSCLVFYSTTYFLTVACQISLVFWLKIEFNLWLNILGNCFLEVINYMTHDGNIYFHILERWLMKIYNFFHKSLVCIVQQAHIFVFFINGTNLRYLYTNCWMLLFKLKFCKYRDMFMNSFPLLYRLTESSIKAMKWLPLVLWGASRVLTQFYLNLSFLLTSFHSNWPVFLPTQCCFA